MTDESAINDAMNAISPPDPAIVRIIMRMFSLCRLILAMRKMRNIRHSLSSLKTVLSVLCGGRLETVLVSKLLRVDFRLISYYKKGHYRKL